MAAGQPLRGLVGQSMDGRKALPSSYVASYGPGSFTWTCPETGYYRFVQWAPGGTGSGTNQGGGSGAHAQSVERIVRGQTVALSIGGAYVPASTVVTLPTRVITTTAGASGLSGGAGGTATGGDINLNGSAGGNAGGPNGAAGLGNNGGAGGVSGAGGGGAGAPGQGPFSGGRGADNASSINYTPGGGGSGNGAQGGSGFVIILRQFDRKV